MLAETATRRRLEAVNQLQMQVNQIVGRAVAALIEERVTGDGEIIEVAVRSPAPPPFVEDVPAEKEPFGRWLLSQVPLRRDDLIGDLARMAKGDPGFPKQGDPEMVRNRLGLAGADGDIFDALDDAEREWERL